MGLKEISDKNIGKIIDAACNVALGGMDVITKLGFSDFSEIDGIKEADDSEGGKEKILSELNKDPLNIKLRQKIVQISEENFEVKASEIHKEILELLD